MPSVLKGKGWVPAKRMFSGVELGGREEGQSSLGAFSHSQPFPLEFPPTSPTVYPIPSHPSIYPPPPGQTSSGRLLKGL